MANVFFDNPPLQSGTPEQYLQTLYGYLHRMSDQLNQALSSITVEQLAPEVQVMVTTGTQDTNAVDQADLKKRAEQLKTLIIKNAQEVERYETVIREELDGYYKTVSDQFGTYERKMSQEIEASASGIIQNFHITETLQAHDEELQNFIQRINTYIYSGILDNGETGIAIGENVTDPEDGHLRSDNQTATFTKNRLGFWQGNREVAYFSNNQFHINEGIIDNSLRMGGHIWKVLTNGAIALMKA